MRPMPLIGAMVAVTWAMCIGCSVQPEPKRHSALQEDYSLERAIKSHNLVVLRDALVPSEMDLDVSLVMGRPWETPLWTVMETWPIETLNDAVLALLEAGAAPRYTTGAPDSHCGTSIICHARSRPAGLEGRVKLLLEFGASPFERMLDGKFALANGIPDSADPRLLRAERGIQQGDHELLSEAFGAGLSANTKIGRMPLLAYAAGFDNASVIKLIIDEGADIDGASEGTGEAALSVASIRGNLDVVRVLIESGADVNQQDAFGRRALDFALKAQESAQGQGSARIASIVEILSEREE